MITMNRLPLLLAIILYYICILLCLIPISLIWLLGGNKPFTHFIDAFSKMLNL